MSILFGDYKYIDINNIKKCISNKFDTYRALFFIKLDSSFRLRKKYNINVL